MAAARMQRWSVELGGYQYEIQFRKTEIITVMRIYYMFSCLPQQDKTLEEDNMVSLTSKTNYRCLQRK